MSETLQALAVRFTHDVLNRMSDDELREFLVNAASERAESLAPAQGLRFLFGLDEALYPLQGWLAVAYDGGVHTKHRHTRYHDFFVNRIKEGERVLDIGCGIGALAKDVAVRSGARVVGIDLSMQNIRNAVENRSHPSVTYLLGDAVRSPLRGSFDVVILSNVLEHLDGRPEFLREVVRETRPLRLLLRVPVFERDWRVPLKKELGMDYRLDPTHFIEYTLEDFAAEMDAAHLEVAYQEGRWGEIWAEAVPRDSG